MGYKIKGLSVTKDDKPTLTDFFFGKYFWVWIVLIFVLCIGLNISDSLSKPPAAPKYVSPEDQLIKDAVTLQLRIERQEKERRDKIEKEYERQKREGR